MEGANIWATARLPDGDGRLAEVSVNGFGITCDVPVDPQPEPGGPTPMGLLAASLAACTAMTARTFLQRWRAAPGGVNVRVAVAAGSPPALYRELHVESTIGPELREQLAAAVDSSPVTVLLRDSITITTVLRTGA
ncbi:MAG TPA: OsmC family protein [Pseudonocardia sp.]|nr:OsmC family protein [Pseudonocardia sp.]